MSIVLSHVSRLKPEIRLAQAVSQFEADLSSDQKATFRTYRSQSQDSPPDPSDVMRLTAEIDYHASRKIGGGRCFGPRLTNFLQAVQQFAALGDVIIGGSQNLIACGVWSLVRMSMLVGNRLLAASSTDIFLVNCKLLFLPGKVIDSPHDRRSLGSPLPNDGLAISPLQEYTVVPARIFHCGGSSLSSIVEVHTEVHLGAICI